MSPRCSKPIVPIASSPTVMANALSGSSRKQCAMNHSASASEYGFGNRSLRLRQIARSLAWRASDGASLVLHERMVPPSNFSSTSASQSLGAESKSKFKSKFKGVHFKLGLELGLFCLVA